MIIGTEILKLAVIKLVKKLAFLGVSKRALLEVTLGGDTNVLNVVQLAIVSKLTETILVVFANNFVFHFILLPF